MCDGHRGAQSLVPDLPSQSTDTHLSGPVRGSGVVPFWSPQNQEAPLAQLTLCLPTITHTHGHSVPLPSLQRGFPSRSWLCLLSLYIWDPAWSPYGTHPQQCQAGEARGAGCLVAWTTVSVKRQETSLHAPRGRHRHRLGRVSLHASVWTALLAAIPVLRLL